MSRPNPYDNPVLPLNEQLFKTCSNGTLEEVRALLDQGADPNAPYFYGEGDGCRDFDDYYCIHEAACNPNIRVFDLLVERGANPLQPDFWGSQPLAYAAKTNSLEMVQHLVKLGNDPDLCNLDGVSVLTEAALNPDVKVIEYLLNCGAQLDNGASEFSELLQAVRYGTPDRVRFFIDRGSSLDLRENCLKDAPIENLRILLEAGFNPNVVTDDWYLGDKQIGHPHPLVDDLDPERRAFFIKFGAKPSSADDTQGETTP